MSNPCPARFLSVAIACMMAIVLAACSTTSATTSVPPKIAIAPLASERYAAIVVDPATGQTLYQANSTVQRFPASLTKMMTLYMLFEAMQQGRVNKATIIPVSPYAASRPPTKIGFRPGQGIDVDSAIKALIVRSANDVATAVGEFLGNGSEIEFSNLMNAKARALGMANTRFQNASGLPDPLQITTARDMATLSIALRRNFPQFYSYFGVTEFTYAGKLIKGHNKLVEDVYGVDGLKTGYIRASGYNVATSVTRSGKRLVVVVMGADNSRERNTHAEQLIEAYLPSPYGRKIETATLPGPLQALDPDGLPGVTVE